MNETTLKAALYDWLSAALGTRETFTITFNADFVTGNVINGTFDGDLMDAVAFDTNHTTTLENLAAEIQTLASIFKATVTGARQITCIGLDTGEDITLVGPTVTGGASQAVATKVVTEEAEAVTVYFADQIDNTGRNAPQPAYPCACIRVNNVQKLGWDELREIDDANIATFGGQRRATVNISYFGQNPIQGVVNAYNSLEKQTVIDALSADGIAILEKNDVQNLTNMLETKFEPRADFDFYIGFADNFEDDLGIIETVELSGEYTGGQTGTLNVGPDIIGT